MQLEPQEIAVLKRCFDVWKAREPNPTYDKSERSCILSLVDRGYLKPEAFQIKGGGNYPTIFLGQLAERYPLPQRGEAEMEKSASSPTKHRQVRTNRIEIRMAKSRLGRFLMNPWVSSLGTGLVLLLGSGGTIAGISGTTLLHGIGVVLLLRIPLWIAVPAGVVVYLIARRRRKGWINEVNITAALSKYTTDNLDGWSLRWRWHFDSSTDQYGIRDLRPMCTKCGGDLVQKDTSRSEFGYLCPECGDEYPNRDTIEVGG